MRVSARWGFIYLLTMLIAVVDVVLKSQLGTVVNTGVALGIPFGNGLALLLMFSLFIAVALISILQNRLYHLVNIVVLVSLSNFADRIVVGGVRDYIAILGYSVNLADIMISSIVLYIAIVIIKQEWINYKQPNKNQVSA